MTTAPLVSFVVFSYNQEEFVHHAVGAAFRQTYDPLEIILSDDCSTDRTFKIMQEMAAAYRGTHRVVLNRNPTNLFIPQHVNRIMQLARGQLIIIGAGDDISFPNRAERLTKEWRRAGSPRVLLTSGFEVIDENGTSLGSKQAGPATFDSSSIAKSIQASFKICGATHAWHRDVFHAFGPFEARRPSEDSFLFLRACLLDGVLPIKEPLIQYRIRKKAPSIAALRRSVLFQRRGWVHTFRQWQLDISKSPRQVTDGSRHAGLVEIERLRRKNAVRYLAEKAANPPMPTWQAIRMAFSPPLLCLEGARLLLQRLAPWVWRRRRLARAIGRVS